MCNKVLQSGKRCKNKAKYGNYCGVHIHTFPLLELGDDAVSHIIQYVTDPKDLRNFALVSARIQFLIALHTEKMIKYDLPLAKCFDIDFDTPYIMKIRYSVQRKWKYILFLAIGGLFVNFKTAGGKFYFNNKIISIDILQGWHVRRPKCKISDDEYVFCINVKEITRTTYYNTKFETTDFDKIEQFFWKQFILGKNVNSIK